MGGSSSKNSIFDENPKDYIDVLRNRYLEFDVKSWRIVVNGHSTCFYIRARRLFPDYHTYEFVYQIIIVNKHHWRRKTVIRGVQKLKNADYFFSRGICYAGCGPNDEKFIFQAVVYAFIENNGLRKLNFVDENIYGKSMTVVTTERSLEIPIQFINIREPLLAKYIDKKKPDPKLDSCSEEFFQVFHGVHLQLEEGNIRSLLKISAKFQVLNVKRYCEQQLIRREDLEVSKKRRFKLACKYNLNILMNQLLRNVLTVKKLAKLASIAVETKSMDKNISKLLIAKMYHIS